MIKDDSNGRPLHRARAPKKYRSPTGRWLARACGMAVSEEHARWAGELHDTIAQDLTAVTLQLEIAAAALAQGDSRSATASVARALEVSRDCARQLRRFMRDAPPAAESAQGLSTALRSWIDGLLLQTPRPRLYVRLSRADRALERGAQGELLRIAQEALANAIRHARSDRIRVTWKRFDVHWLLSIEDNGIGFEAAAPGHAQRMEGMGLRLLAERARRIGAQLHCRSVPGRGTHILVFYPVPPLNIAGV